jgi:cephalosporin hydroxylase
MENFYYDFVNNQILLDNGDLLSLSDPKAFQIVSNSWLRAGWDVKYVYGFTWLGRPIIQLPEDLIRVQEVIYTEKPDVIIETGVAHGGSLIFYASLLEIMGKGCVIGVDIEIRKHNRAAIENHTLSKRINLIEGSSVDQVVVEKVQEQIEMNDKVLVILDSNHSYEHVLKELVLYAELVSVGSYMVVCDGIMSSLAGAPRSGKDWSWNNPLTALREFVNKNPRFEICEPKFLFNEGLVSERITYWPNSFLKRIY